MKNKSNNANSANSGVKKQLSTYKKNKIQKHSNYYNNVLKNFTYHKNWSMDENYEDISPLLDGWKFKVFKNEYALRIEATSESNSCGIGVKVAAFINKKNVSNSMWFHQVWVSNNTADPPPDVQKKDSEDEIDFEISIKSIDDKYSKWFDIFKIDQNGISMKFGKTKHAEMFKLLGSLNELMEKMKARILLENFS